MAKNETAALELTANASAKDSLMYIGDRRMDPIPLEKGNVFKEFPPLLQRAVAEDKTLSALFVPLSQAGKALREQERSSK